MTWQKIPFVRLLFPLVLGIVIYDYVGVFNSLSISFALGVSFFLLLLISYYRSPSISLIRTWGGIGFMTVLLLGMQISDFRAVDKCLFDGDSFGKEQITHIATINNQPKLNAKTIKAELRVNAVVDSLGEQHKTATTILAYFKLDTQSVKLNYGDQLLIHSSISTIAPPTNPDAFDAQNYYSNQRIYYQTYLPSNHWEVVQTGKVSIWKSIRYQIQGSLQQIIRKYIRGPNEQAVAIALLLGAKEGLSKEIKNAYADTGAMHVLAVSGLHIGVIAGILMALLNWIGITTQKRKKLRAVLLLTALWFFALLTGGSASVLRAATMFSFLILGQSLGRSINIYNSLAASALILLCIEPYLIYNVGFQLSYVALIGIVYYHPKIYKWFYFEEKILDWLWNGIAVSLAAQIATLPIGLYYFHQFPVFFWLSGVIVTAAAGIILFMGLVLFCVVQLPTIGAWLGEWVGELLYWAIWSMNSLIFLIQKLPYAIVEGFWLPSWQLWLSYLVIIGVTYTLLKRQLKYAIVPLFILLGMSFCELVEAVEQQQQHKVVVYDVRRSTAIDIIKGKSSITLASSAIINTPTLDYAHQNHLWALGVTDNHTIAIQRDSMINEYCYYDYPVLETNNQRFLIIDKALESKESYIPLEVDYVIICDNPKLKNIRQIEDLCTYDYLIIDHSNAFWRVQKWKTQCQEVGIEFIDIATDGAFSLDIAAHPN